MTKKPLGSFEIKMNFASFAIAQLSPILPLQFPQATPVIWTSAIEV